jgi:aldose 1-epimerase
MNKGEHNLENQWLRVTVLSYGATIASIIDKTLQRELVLGFTDSQKYTTSDKYFGCTIGRVANRIARGVFHLNDEDYQLAVNNGPNHLHGGIAGFDKKEFDCIQSENRIDCTYHSVHMEEGYPGNLDVTISYVLDENQLKIYTKCHSDRDTLVNLTNHTYFNLDSNKGSINHQRLQLFAKKVYPVDENGCTVNQPFDVFQTPFDFTFERLIETSLTSDHSQIVAAKGLDHHFDIIGSGLRLAARLIGNDVALNVYTDKPGIHVYTGNYLNGEDIGHDHAIYQQNCGICFEAQYVPNSINFDITLAPIVKADQIQEHLTIFEFQRLVNEVKYEH